MPVRLIRIDASVQAVEAIKAEANRMIAEAPYNIKEALLDAAHSAETDALSYACNLICVRIVGTHEADKSYDAELHLFHTEHSMPLTGVHFLTMSDGKGRYLLRLSQEAVDEVEAACRSRNN